jgi:hypothetical protein
MHTCLEHRADILSEMAKKVLPPQLPAPAAKTASGLSGINPKLLPVALEGPLSPAQRAALLPHWHSFLEESRVARQELRATLARISSDPAALVSSLGEPHSSQAAAQVSARLHVPRCTPPPSTRAPAHAGTWVDTCPCSARSRCATPLPRWTSTTRRSCSSRRNYASPC